ncbi:MAG TPA: 30S ribosomal protein S7 [Candidatus Acidoferrales bacterium]|nr:30S ribosomal protein S7 [Candidatus Acidoferrales bacterium]
MPRKGKVDRRQPPADAVYGSPLVQKFINCMMWDGKRSKAERIFYDSMELVRQRSNEEPDKVFSKAMENCKPLLEVKTRRVGGANYQIPVEVNPERRQSLAIRWLRDFARARPGKSMKEKLAEEIMDAAQNRGGAIKKKEDTHRMAEANKAFAHYRW